jgi:hypothetical protein
MRTNLTLRLFAAIALLCSTAAGAQSGLLYSNGNYAISGTIFNPQAPGLCLLSAGPTSLPIYLPCPASGSGISSIGLTVPSWLSVAGSPLTANGTLAITSATSIPQNYVLASPTSGTGALTPRALVAADIPTLNQNCYAPSLTSNTYTALTSDWSKCLEFSNGSTAATLDLPVATTTGFGAGYYLYVVNYGTAAVTIAPTTSTIGGQSTLVINGGGSCLVSSDGTNYQTPICNPNSSSGSSPGSQTAFLTSPYTNATTGFTSILALPSAPASGTLRGSCDIIMEDSAATAPIYFGVGLSQTPTNLWVTAVFAGTAVIAPTYTPITNTTTTQVGTYATSSTAGTPFVVRLAFTLQNGSSANVLTLYGKSGSTSDTMEVEPGTSCGWLP